MSDAGLVSIIIPLYNGEAYIRETIRSALTQSYENTEIIVVDDGSTDSGPLIASRYPIQIISQKNRGISGARNTGIRASRGEFIALLDQDDIFKPDKIEKQVRFLRENPGCLMVFTPEERFGAHEPKRRTTQRHKSRKTQGDIFLDLYKSNYITPGSTLIQREAFDKAGLFDEDLPVGEEHDLFIRLSYYGMVGFIEEALLEYRWHGDNTSNRWSSKYPFVEINLYRKYLPWLMERTHLWWWIYNKQCAKALRDMGIITLKENKAAEAQGFLFASFIRMPWRYKIIRYLVEAFIRTPGYGEK